MSNKVGSACEHCVYHINFVNGGICGYKGQFPGTQSTVHNWGIDGKIDGQGRLHLPRKFAKQIDVEFGDTVHIEKRDDEEFIRIYKGE